MAHRERRTAQNPDVEASQAELAAIEAQKNTAQNAVLSVAQNKKQVEADFEAAKEKLNEELTAKRSEMVTEMKKLDESLSDKKKKVEATEEVAKKVTEETKQLIVTRDAIQKEVTETNEKRSAANTEVTRLMVLQHNLNDSIKDSRSDYTEAESKLSAVKKEFAEITRQAALKREDHDAIVNHLPFARKEAASVAEEVAQLKSKATDLHKDIVEKTEQKKALDAELLETQKMIADHKQGMATREAEIKTHMGNLALLEQRVDEKTKLWDERQQKAAVDHLEKMGIKAATNG